MSKKRILEHHITDAPETETARLELAWGARRQPSDSRLLAKRKIGLPVGQEIYRLLRSVKDELGRNVPIAYLPPWDVDCGLLLAVASLSFVIAVSVSLNCE